MTSNSPATDCAYLIKQANELAGFDIGFRNRPKPPISNPFEAAPAKLIGSPVAGARKYTDLPTRVEQKLLPPDSPLKNLAPADFRKSVGYNPALAPALPADPESWLRTHRNSPWVHQAVRQLQANNAFEDIPVPRSDPAGVAAWLRQRIIGTSVDKSHPSLQGAPKAPWDFGFQQGWDDRDTKRMALRVAQADTMHNLREDIWFKKVQDMTDKLRKNFNVSADSKITQLGVDLGHMAEGAGIPPTRGGFWRTHRRYSSYGILPGLGVPGVGVNKRNVLEPSLAFSRKLAEPYTPFYSLPDSLLPDNTALLRAGENLPLWLTSTPQERRWVDSFGLLPEARGAYGAAYNLSNTAHQVWEANRLSRNPLMMQAAQMYDPAAYKSLKQLRIVPRRLPEFKFPEDVPNADHIKKGSTIKHAGVMRALRYMAKVPQGGAPATSAIKQVAQTVVAPPKPKDYADLLRAVFNASK